jgi:hypothetical protein
MIIMVSNNVITILKRLSKCSTINFKEIALVAIPLHVGVLLEKYL